VFYRVIFITRYSMLSVLHAYKHRWTILHWKPSYLLVSSRRWITWWRWNSHLGITRRQSAVVVVICWFTGAMVLPGGFTSLHWLTEFVPLFTTVNLCSDFECDC